MALDYSALAKTLALTGSQRAEVRAILDAHLASDVTESVFGSRAGGKPKPWSDLDILLEGPAALPLAVLAELAEAFDESALPWKVDIVDRHTVNEAFAKILANAPRAMLRSP